MFCTLAGPILKGVSRIVLSVFPRGRLWQLCAGQCAALLIPDAVWSPICLGRCEIVEASVASASREYSTASLSDNEEVDSFLVL